MALSATSAKSLPKDNKVDLFARISTNSTRSIPITDTFQKDFNAPVKRESKSQDRADVPGPGTFQPPPMTLQPNAYAQVESPSNSPPNSGPIGMRPSPYPHTRHIASGPRLNRKEDIDPLILQYASRRMPQFEEDIEFPELMTEKEWEGFKPYSTRKKKKKR
jgi:hypothetical protein